MRAKEPPIRFLTHVSLAVYLIEAGLVLVLAPWTMWWQRNYFADLLPWVRPVMDTASVRSVVVVTGVVTAVAGMSDLRAALFGRSDGPSASGERAPVEPPTSSES